MTTVLTLPPLSALGGGAMLKILRGFVYWPGHTHVPVNYPIALDSSLGDSPTGTIQVGAAALNKLIRGIDGDIVVVTHSQGGQCATSWLKQHANTRDAPSPDRLSFILTGNPVRRYGHAPWITEREITPDNTQYKITDIGRRWDGWANFSWNPRSLIGMFAPYGHTDYSGVDLNNAANTYTRVGNTTYVLTP